MYFNMYIYCTLPAAVSNTSAHVLTWTVQLHGSLPVDGAHTSTHSTAARRWKEQKKGISAARGWKEQKSKERKSHGHLSNQHREHSEQRPCTEQQLTLCLPV